MWAILGLSAASRGTKLLVSAGICATLAVLAFFAYSQIASSYERAEQRGYDRGKAEVTARWNEAQTKVLAANAALEKKWRTAADDAVAAYKAEEAARQPAVAAATKERIVYVEAPVNRNTVGIDAAGVSVLRQNRSANGIPAGSAATPAAR